MANIQNVEVVRNKREIKIYILKMYNTNLPHVADKVPYIIIEPGNGFFDMSGRLRQFTLRVNNGGKIEMRNYFIGEKATTADKVLDIISNYIVPVGLAIAAGKLIDQHTKDKNLNTASMAGIAFTSYVGRDQIRAIIADLIGHLKDDRLVYYDTYHKVAYSAPLSVSRDLLT